MKNKDFMMSNLHIKKIMISALISLMCSGCAPFVPDNYLAPGTVRLPQKIKGRWVKPNIIPISPKMFETLEGRELIEPALKPQPYRVGSFDNLNIIVWGHPELSTVATSTAALSQYAKNGSDNNTSMVLPSLTANNPAVLVQTNGTIYYPFVGHLLVSGLTIDEIQNKIAKRLTKYVRNPQVTVQVAKYRYRNTYVLGEVKAPGMQPLTDKPLTLMEALSNAGGINPASSDPSHIYLIRGSFEHPTIYWLNAQSPQSLMIAEQFPLQENDIVYVSAAIFNSWNNFVQTVFPTFTTYYTIKGLSSQ